LLLICFSALKHATNAYYIQGLGMLMRSLPFLLIACLMLLFMIGEAEADELLPLAGGPDWYEVDNEPPEVGDGAMGVTWDQTGIATDSLDISIDGAGVGYTPSDPTVQLGTTVTWTNADTVTHTVTDKDGQFDSFDISPGETWSMTFTEVGAFSYYCKFHPMMEGSITVVSDISADEQARTSYIEVWTAETNLVFWANFSMSDDDTIEVLAQKKGYALNSTETMPLNEQYGFSILCLSNGTTMGDSLIGSTDDEWKQYQIYLDSEKLGYNNLDYDPYEDNAYSFVFHVKGIEGSAAIGGVELIRTLDTGFYFGKDDVSTLTYDIFPSLAVEINYFAKNIGTEDNTFRINPELDAQGNYYEGAAFDIYIMVRMNGEEFDEITSSSNDDGTWTHEFDMAPDDEAVITIHITAPEYNQETGEPAGNRKFDLELNAYDTGSDDELREPRQANLFIKPSQFVLGDVSFNRNAVLEGDSLDITVKAWNEGNYASNVLVAFYVIDQNGTAYATPNGVLRMTRVASTTVDMAPKAVLENDGVYQTWYYATATWEEAFIPETTVEEWQNVEIYAQINPLSEQIDLDAGATQKDEYLALREDNGAFGNIMVVERLIESVDCYVDPYPISLQSFIFLPYSEPDEPCSEDQVISFSMIASEDGRGTWTISMVRSNPQISVNYVHWYLLDEMGNTVSDGLASEVYGYYSGQGKAVVFIDSDFNGKLSPGDKFEVHPAEPDSDLAGVSDVTDYSLKIRIYAEGEPQEEDSNNGGFVLSCIDGDTKTAEDGCNQCVCNNGEWVCTEVDCKPDASDDNMTVPAVSLISSIAAIGIIALRRRY
jgi:plastocyanin